MNRGSRDLGPGIVLSEQALDVLERARGVVEKLQNACFLELVARFGRDAARSDDLMSLQGQS